MASPATAPPSEPRAPLAARIGLSLAVVLPLVLIAYTLAAEGWLSDTHGAFLHRVHFALERGRLELLGFEYPPLPFLLLVPWATVTMTWLLGAAAVAAIAWFVVDECTDRRSILPLILLVSALWTPIGLHLVVSDFNEAVGLLALFVGWRHYRRWWQTRQTVHGLYTGLWLGLAFYTSPLGLAVALIAGAVLPLIFPRLQIPPFASQLVLLVFPGFATAATWAYLSWVFIGHVELPFRPWERGSPELLTMMAWSLPYMFVALLALIKPKATSAGMLLPLALLWIANRIGWHFSLAFSVLFLTLVAVVALPRGLKLPTRALLGSVAIGQAILAWLIWPMPTLTPEDRAAKAVATALADAPARSVLIDDRFALELLKWSPSMEPYLTTLDTGFEVALTQPMNTVRYVLATPDREGLTLDADVRPPSGFIKTWSWRGYSLWRHPDAPTPVLQFTSLERASQ